MIEFLEKFRLQLAVLPFLIIAIGWMAQSIQHLRREKSLYPIVSKNLEDAAYDNLVASLNGDYRQVDSLLNEEMRRDGCNRYAAIVRVRKEKLMNWKV